MRALRILPIAILLAVTTGAAQQSYYGFDKNGYPGDSLLAPLRRTFAFSGYWLNPPPGMQSNPWMGKRAAVRAAGLGFLLLFNGRADEQLQHAGAADLGSQDGRAAAAAARREGFPARAVIFLDQEEGGRLLPEQADYVGAWLAAVRSMGFSAGIYCSGITVGSGSDAISTAQDVARRFPAAKLWVWNDQCPPSPGCMIPERAMAPSRSGIAQALVWQYAETPRRAGDTAGCISTYARDNSCYAPRLPHAETTFVDLNVSSEPDPSHAR
jgi:hypothetical protein